MANLVAIAYDDMDQAERVMRSMEATRDKVVPEISKYGGRVIQSSQSNEQQQAVQEALDARGAAV